MRIHKNIRVSGVVQNINFRGAAAWKAEELDVRGFVQNEPDGSVYVETEGEQEAIEKFIAWCHVGPPLARVDAVGITDGDLKEYTGFEIRWK